MYPAVTMKILDVPQSGSVGARTSSRNRSGQYVRQRAIPTQPRTPAQVNQRARLSDAAAAWRGLTDAQRAAWNAFAQSFTVVNSLGQTINLTGAQCYVKVNTVNSLNGDAQVSVPPPLPTFLPSTVTGITADSVAPALALNGAAAAVGTDQMVFCSPQLSAGVTFNGNFRWLVTNPAYVAGVATILAVYTAKFGALIAGKKVFVKVVQSQQGMQDNGTLYSTIVT